MSIVWDYCQPSAEQLDCIQVLQRKIELKESSETIQINNNTAIGHHLSPINNSFIGGYHHLSNNNNSILIDNLQSTEEQCRYFIEELDGILKNLDDISFAHGEVTARTNNLMSSCENLLEQQHSLQDLVHSIQEAITPFNNVEDFAHILGIPVDAYGNKSSSKQRPMSNSLVVVNSATPSSDPRSAEFLRTMNHITTAMKFCQQHPEMKDIHLYKKWLKQLQARAHSITTRNMLELLTFTDSTCRTLMAQQTTFSLLQTPIESLPIYQKFRALGFRMRQLSALLPNLLDDITLNDEDNFELHTQSSMNPVVEVKQGYVNIRTQLLASFLTDVSKSTPNTTSSVNTTKANLLLTNNSTTQQQQPTVLSLCAHIRQEFSHLIRIAQLEQQLFIVLFKQIELAANNNNRESSGDSSTAIVVTGGSVEYNSFLGPLSLEYFGEVENIIESLCSYGLTFLRPIIIQECSIDELCRVISSLAEDIRGQISAMKLPRALVRRLTKLLEEIVHDSQERLVYCAELVLRQEIQLFEPLPSQLNYPDILERKQQNKSGGAVGGSKLSSLKRHGSTSSTTSSTAGDLVVEEIDVQNEITGTWYPPLTSALSLLSKIYGIVEKSVFEDFARRTVDQLLLSLRKGSELVKRKGGSALHGDLFLIRHILILREQLTPFETSLQTTQKYLDFTPTAKAFTTAFTSRSILRFDASNGLVQLAIHGLPSIHDTLVDTKKDIDSILKLSCLGLKQSSIKMILGPIEGFLAKVTAFTGSELNLNTTNSTSTSTTANMATDEILVTLRAQSFMKHERILEMLNIALDTVSMSAPDLKTAMELYIDNQSARSILLKPVLHEIDLGKKKLGYIITNYLDSTVTPSPRREYEQLLISITAAAHSALN